MPLLVGLGYEHSQPGLLWPRSWAIRVNTRKDRDQAIASPARATSLGEAWTPSTILTDHDRPSCLDAMCHYRTYEVAQTWATPVP